MQHKNHPLLALVLLGCLVTCCSSPWWLAQLYPEGNFLSSEISPPQLVGSLNNPCPKDMWAQEAALTKDGYLVWGCSSVAHEFNFGDEENFTSEGDGWKEMIGASGVGSALLKCNDGELKTLERGQEINLQECTPHAIEK